MLNRKFKEAREKRNSGPTREVSEAKPNTPIRDAEIDFQNIIKQWNHREVFLTLNESGKLPSAKPMSKELMDMRRNGEYCEYHRDVNQQQKLS